MSTKFKVILGVVGGLISAAIIFCLAVLISCSINGLTFSQQVINWFSSSSASKDVVKDVAETVSHMRLG